MSPVQIEEKNWGTVYAVSAVWPGKAEASNPYRHTVSVTLILNHPVRLCFIQHLSWHMLNLATGQSSAHCWSSEGEFKRSWGIGPPSALPHVPLKKRDLNICQNLLTTLQPLYRVQPQQSTISTNNVCEGPVYNISMTNHP